MVMMIMRDITYMTSLRVAMIMTILREAMRFLIVAMVMTITRKTLISLIRYNFDGLVSDVRGSGDGYDDGFSYVENSHCWRHND